MMVRAKSIIIVCACFSLLLHQGVLSKPAKPRGRPRYTKSRTTKIKPEKIKPPDPALEWKDCGEECLSRLFNNEISSVRVPPVKGDLGDVAVQGDYFYLLVKNFNLIADAIFTIRKSSGRIESIWGIGRHNAVALSCDGQYLWVLSRSEKYFLRKLTLSGKPAGDVSVKSIPEGAISGLACAGDSLVFSSGTDAGSSLYLFNRQNWKMKKLAGFAGTIHGVAYHQGKVIAYLDEFDAYSSNWLLAIDASTGQTKKISFVNTVPRSLASDGKRAYILETRQGAAFISPVVVRIDGNLVVASPVVQRIEMEFPVINGNSNAFSADLWVPYPMNRRFQNVRQVTIDPKPREIIADRFGNRWAHVRWDRASGSVRAVLKFDIITAAVAFTVPRDYDLKSGDVPESVRSASLGETSAFDLSNFVVKSHSSRIELAGSYLARILSIRNYINGAIRFSAYDERWGKASDYLFRGRGDAYGQTLGFAALSRYLGIPARAAGGLIIDGSRKENDAENGMAWNQVYIPGTGWVDLGIGRDYGNAREYFAGRPNRCFITFEGDFDRADYSTIFAETEWSRACRWASLDEKRKASVTPGAVRINVKDLKE
jgi:hypothetical protein